jgi:hypothetical protein
MGHDNSSNKCINFNVMQFLNHINFSKKKKTPEELLFILCSFLLSRHFEILKFHPIPFFISEPGYFKA